MSPSAKVRSLDHSRDPSMVSSVDVREMVSNVDVREKG
jgi:hypothetical protein